MAGGGGSWCEEVPARRVLPAVDGVSAAGGLDASILAVLEVPDYAAPGPAETPQIR